MVKREFSGIPGNDHCPFIILISPVQSSDQIAEILFDGNIMLKGDEVLIKEFLLVLMSVYQE